jgi:hypothetical protein
MDNTAYRMEVWEYTYEYKVRGKIGIIALEHCASDLFAC